MSFRDGVQKIFTSTAQVDLADDRNRFNVLYQKMLNTRWYITILTLLTLLAILVGIVLAIFFNVHVAQEWKEILLLLLGAFIGSYNRVIDHWFNNSQRDDKLLEKMDQENDTDALVKAKLEAASRKGNGNVPEDPAVPEVVAPVPSEAPVAAVAPEPAKPAKGKK